MSKRFFPDWQTFAYKYRGREQDAFEDLARNLFRKEMGINYGLFQRVNHKGNETDVVENDGKVIGFQAKFFKNGIDADNIIHSMRGAKERNPNQTHYYIYCNCTFGEPKPRKNAKIDEPVPDKTKEEEKIENAAKDLGLILIWKLDHAVLDEVNAERWIYEVFFCVEENLENLIGEEKRHSEIAFGKVDYACFYNGQKLHIKRDYALKQISNLQPGSTCIIFGDGGCGKTALLHEFFDNHTDEIPICYRKATSMNVNNLAQVFHQGDMYGFTDFKEAYKNCEKKYFVIDSAERLDEIEDDTIIQELIKGLLEDHWIILFTVRTVFLTDLLNILTCELHLNNTAKIQIDQLTEKELKSFAKRNGIQLPKDILLFDRIKNLFYLSLFTEYYEEINTYSDVRTFMEFVWDKKIKGERGRKGYIRESEFEKFISDRMKAGTFFLPQRNYTSETFYSLVKDDIIADDPSKGLFITHDIFEEWGMYRLVDRYWEERETIIGFLSKLGETRAVRRAFRLWLKDKVTENLDSVKALTDAAFTPSLPQNWKDEVLCAILQSDRAKLLLQDLEEMIVYNYEGLSEKIIWSLRVGCRYVKEVTNYKDFYIAQYAPFGSGWEYIIDLVYKNKDEVQLCLWLPLLQDWSKSNHRGETTRKAGLMMIDYYQTEEYKREGWHDGIRKRVHEIINDSVWEIKDELTNLLHKCIEDRELSDDLPEFILQESYGAFNIHFALPQVVAGLCLFYWKERKEDDDSSRWHSHWGYNAFGLDEYGVGSKYFPAGAMQTPTITLLIADEKTGVGFVVKLMNGCVEKYSCSEWKDSLDKVEVIDGNGKKNWQWHSQALWCTYRGTSSPVVPYSLQSVHMALERYMLNLSRDGKFAQCKAIMKRLLFECHSSSVSAVVASLVLAYPNQFWEEALVLFRTIVFIQEDARRALLEHEARSLCGIGGVLNMDVYKERMETCNQEFRKSHIENVCLNYQFIGSRDLDEEKNERLIQTIYGILDEHRKMLRKAKGKEKQLLEILLSRMDRRRLTIKSQERVKGGIAIQFETLLTPEAKLMSESSEMENQERCKYLGLQNWAIALFKGERGAIKQIYDDSPHKAIEDAQLLEKELEEGRQQFLTGYETLNWVSASMIKFHQKVMTDDELAWCKRIIDQKISNYQGVPDVLDGIMACIHVVPLLIELYPEEKERYIEIFLKCLKLPNYGNNSISDCVITAIQTFDLWKKNTSLMEKLLVSYIHIVENTELQPRHLKLILGLLPNNPNAEHEKIAVKYLELISSFFEGSDDFHNRDFHNGLFEIIDTIALLFLRTDSNVILENIHLTNEIVKDRYLSQSYLTKLILEEDSHKKPDRFWKIWNSYRELVPGLIARGGDTQLKTYTLNILWNEDAKEWHSLRREDLDFFNYLGEQCMGNHTIFEGIVKILTTIGHSYKTEGMKWISTAIEKNSGMTLVNSNALMYLELVMMPYVYGNKMMIRSSHELLAQVRTILNFMVAKSSVTGYLLRDMVS